MNDLLFEKNIDTVYIKTPFLIYYINLITIQIFGLKMLIKINNLYGLILLLLT